MHHKDALWQVRGEGALIPIGHLKNGLKYFSDERVWLRMLLTFHKTYIIQHAILAKHKGCLLVIRSCLWA